MDYKQKYFEIKHKYLDLKKNILAENKINIISQRGGAMPESTFMMNGFLYKTYFTEDYRRFSFREVSPNKIDFQKDTTNDTRKAYPDKILYINDLDTFDWFSFKYGKYDEFHMYIEWDKVAKDYKGFYLNRNNKNLFLNRYSRARKGSEGKFRMISWWQHEYEDMPSSVLIFK